MQYVTFGASVAGPSHEAEGLPCQDAWLTELCEAHWNIIAVADGAGSAARSEEGARAAVSNAVATIRTFILGSCGVSADEVESLLPHFIREGVVGARRGVEQKAIELKCPLEDLASTLILVLSYNDTVVAAQIGDGGVVATTCDGLVVISEPEQNEYANETTFVTSSTWESATRISTLIFKVAAVAAFSDGCQRVALTKSSGHFVPYSGFCSPLFKYASAIVDGGVASEDLKSLLQSAKLSDVSEDDKTLVVAVMRQE